MSDEVEFAFWPLAEWWRVGGGNVDAGEIVGEVVAEFIECALIAAEEEVLEFSRAVVSGPEGFQHQSRAVYAIGKFFGGGELKIEYPDEWHAVRANQIEAAHGFTELGIALGECGDVGIGGFHGVGLVMALGVLQNPSDGFGVGGGGDG